MGFPWREVIQAAGTGATTMFLPGLAPLIVPALNAALKKNPIDMMEEWGKDIEALAKRNDIGTNKNRALMMKGKIRWDMWKHRGGSPPPKEEVAWMLETLVLTYYGVEGGPSSLE